ncbi:MAG: F0F1 ATP synthase subunit A [Candidatus Goldbacteria bacterium]|nr:F0F1 ATP synthase subunit A [Candidatus Goldiibacteriota bacterium]
MKESLHFQSFIPFLDNHGFTIVVMMLIDYIIVLFLLFLGTRNLKLKPGGSQNLIEWAITLICSYADEIIGKEDAPRFYPLIITLFFYIFIGNLMGLVPGLVSPTSVLSVTAALAIIVFLYEWISGIAKQGVMNYFKHYAGGPGIPGPLKPFLFFIELISDISRPLSLSFRLFGNIMAKEILLSVLIVLVLLFWPTISTNAIGAFLAGFSFVLRPLIIILGVLVSLIQASVFTLLTCIYLAGAVAAHKEHGESH